MSTSVLIIGESGTGKSASIRTLNPKETFIINVLNKDLPFRGSKAQYRKELHNYYSSFDSDDIVRYLRRISANLPNIKTIIIDDFQYLMSNELFSGFGEKKGSAVFDLYNNIGKHAYFLLIETVALREDLIVFVLSHSDVREDGKVNFKTIGKALDKYIVPEGLFPAVFHTHIEKGQYKFLTHHDGVRTAKTPMGMFTEDLIDNDLESIRNIILEYQYAENTFSTTPLQNPPTLI